MCPKAIPAACCSDAPRRPLDSEGADGYVAIASILGVLALVLALACANTANLLLAGAATRRREIGIRLAMGSTTRRSDRADGERKRPAGGAGWRDGTAVVDLVHSDPSIGGRTAAGSRCSCGRASPPVRDWRRADLRDRRRHFAGPVRRARRPVVGVEIAPQRPRVAAGAIDGCKSRSSDSRRPCRCCCS